MAIYTKGADPEALDAAAGRIRQHAEDLGTANDAIRGVLDALAPIWGGHDLDAFSQDARQRALPALTQAATVLTAISGALSRNAARQRGASVPSSSAFVSAPITPPPSGSGGPGDNGGRRDGRDPDGADGRRVATDERTGERGRTDPRDDPPGGASLSNDWAGRAILERYLIGGGDWTLENDPTWTGYMQDNESLRGKLQDSTEAEALKAVQHYHETGDTSHSYRTVGSMEMENGEGIVGYQYLHGTNADVGGFEQQGTTAVESLPSGGYRVTMANHYQWNDVIDPNPEYSTDRWKSRVAEILTLGQADPYDIHIGWDATTTITYDAQGNVVSQEGYPG